MQSRDIPFHFLEPASPTSSCVSVHGWPAQETLVLHIHNPWTRGAPLPNHLEDLISCAASSHHVPSCRTGTMICIVDVWSCALGVRGQSVGPGHECSLPVHSRHQIPSQPSFMSSSSVSPFNSVSFPSRFTLNTPSHFATLTKWWSYGFSLLGLVFHSHSSCHKKSWFAAIERDSLPFSSSISMYFIGATASDGTFTNKSSTCTFPSFLSIDFSFLCLFMMYASSFSMNRSFPAWMMWDGDTRGLLTSATCHVLLRTNPSGVLTDTTCCP